MIAFDKPRTVSEIEFEVGSSTGDRVLSPTLFAGDSVEKMHPVKVAYKREFTKDVIKLEKPVKAKFFRVENNKQSGGFWSVHNTNIK